MGGLSEDQGKFYICVIGSLTCWMIDCAEQKEEVVNMPVPVKHCIWKAMYVILIATFDDPQVGRGSEVSAGWDPCNRFQVDSWSNSNFQTNLIFFP